MFKKIPVSGFMMTGIILFDIFLIIITEPSLNFLNGGILRDYEELIIEPLFFGSLVFLFSVVLLFFFSHRIFINWLKYLVSWYVPVAILFISTIDVNSGFILNISRSTAALYWMGGLFFITVVYVVINSKMKEITNLFPSLK